MNNLYFAGRYIPPFFYPFALCCKVLSSLNMTRE